MTNLRHHFLIVLALLQLQCSDDLAQKSPVKEHIVAEKDGFIPIVKVKVSAKESLDLLKTFLKRPHETTEQYRDIEAILKARALEESKGSPSSIQNQWRQAMNYAKEGALSKIAFEGWVVAYGKALNKTVEPEVMAKLILAETQQGATSAYMTKEGITSTKPLIKILKKIAAQWLTEPAPLQLAKAPQGLPANDPLLTETAQKNCKGMALDTSSWSTWKSTLPVPVLDYFNGLVAQCAKDTATAMDKLETAAMKLSKEESVSSQTMALEAFSRLATMQRASGLRREAADTYKSMMDIWENDALTADSFAISAFSFYKRKINDFLWASRYRALISDYEQAKIYGQKALSISQKALTSVSSLSESQSSELEDLKAEAYHTLSSRIAVEQKQWESAASLNLIALKASNLSDEWRNRVMWLAGLYEYIAGNYAKAKLHWTQHLNGSPEKSQVPMTLFWLARAEDKLGNPDSRDLHIENLIRTYPLSFYSTSGLVASKMRTEATIKENLLKIFGAPNDIKIGAFYQGSISILQPRNALVIDNRFKDAMMKSELLFTLKNPEFADVAAKDFEQLIKNLDQDGSLKPQVEEAAWTYASRLFFASHNYQKTISISHKMALESPQFWQRWPEHLAVFFPTPYIDFYKDASEDNQVEYETLLGISRQESAFTPKIESSAGALGLMQLIRPTGKKYADELGLKNYDIEDLLNDPKSNIKLGARYIKSLTKRYSGNIPSIFAGYNAGEHAVDQWIKKRFHSDPLIFIELIPFGETKDYVKNVWRNTYVYTFLTDSKGTLKISLNP